MRGPDESSQSGFNTTAVLSEPCLVFAPGASFAGRYQIIEELGSTPVGCSYKVYDSGVQEILCLKLINPQVLADRDVTEEMQGELAKVCRLEHPHINRVVHFGRHNGTYYVTRRYVSGQNLEHMLRMVKRLNGETAVDMALQICEGLASAHARGVGHGALRPGCIMLDRHGRVQVVGFGLDRFLWGRQADRSQESPEELLVKQDIHDLGKILYLMVTGSEVALDPGLANPLLPEGARRVIRRCLDLEGGEPYRDLGEMQADLEAAVGNLQILPPIRPKRGVVSRFQTKSTWWKTGILTPLLLGLLFLARIAFLEKGKAEAASLEPARIMLAVLPFENLGPEQDEYFAAGLTEELSSRLSCLSGLGVISRHSARYYKDTEKTPRQIHQELGVDYILDGSVQWVRPEGEQERVRVTAQLIRAADDTPLWSELNNLVLEDIFEVQSRIAEDVASKLDLTVLEPEREALSENPTADLEAYDLYLQAGYSAGEAFSQADLGRFEQAVAQLEEAVRIDPYFIMARVTLAVTHQWMYVTGLDHTPERLEKAWQALEEAKRLDADFPEVMLAEGLLHYRAYHDYAKACQLFEEVKKVRPNLPYTYLGYIQRRQGEWQESLESLERGFTFNPRSADLAYQIGTTYLHLREYDQAVLWCNRAISIDEDFFFPYLAKVRVALLGRGDIDEARRISENIPEHRYADYLRCLLCLLDRDFQGALQVLETCRFEAFVGEDFYMPKSLLQATVLVSLGDWEAGRSFARQARDLLVAALASNPDDARQRLSLGLALALLGEREEAVRQGEEAVAACPLERDAFCAPRYALGLAGIYAHVGRVEDAVRILDRLLSIPAGNVMSLTWLKIDPSWDVIRAHPYFQRLVRKHERAAEGGAEP